MLHSLIPGWLYLVILYGFAVYAGALWMRGTRAARVEAVCWLAWVAICTDWAAR